MAAGQQGRLSQDEAEKLEAADKNQVVSALARIRGRGSNNWLEPNNPYVRGAAEQIKLDNKAIPSSRMTDFTEYIAASAVVHCGDAWAYFGRAVDAIIKGDVHAAVHLAYYAELRGAISLLATEGIYVGNFFNCAVNAQGQIVTLPGDGTHVAAWRLLDSWKDQPRSRVLVGDVLRPGGTSLNDWLANLPTGGGGPVVGELLQSMAFDLQSFANDRVRRNSVSYAPSRLVEDDLDPLSAVRIVSNIWATLEPDAKGTFPVMDQQLLGSVLMQAYTSTNTRGNASPGSTDAIDQSAWEAWLEHVVPDTVRNSFFHQSLRELPTVPLQDRPLVDAFNNDHSEVLAAKYVADMVARTSVLLRLTTGANLRLILDSGIEKGDVDPWVKSLSVARGLWATGDQPEDAVDLWVDAAVALDVLSDLSPRDPYELLSSLGSHAITLGQTERVVAWSFS